MLKNRFAGTILFQVLSCSDCANVAEVKPTVDRPVIAARACDFDLTGQWQVEAESRRYQVVDDGGTVVVRLLVPPKPQPRLRHLIHTASSDGGLGQVAFVALDASVAERPAASVAFQRQENSIESTWRSDAGVITSWSLSGCRPSQFQVTQTEAQAASVFILSRVPAFDAGRADGTAH